MIGSDAETNALKPLWRLATGAACGAAASALATSPGPPWLRLSLLVLGVVAFAAVLTRGPRAWGALWLLAGLALVAGRGLDARVGHLALERRLAAGQETAVRARVVVVEGWTRARWGYRARGRIEEARLPDEALALPRTCRLEIRGESRADQLPPPGAVVQILASVRGQPRRPLLVVSSPRLVRDTGVRRVLPALRDRLARSLFLAADTHTGRIRAAELAAALALGRRDLVPSARKDRWRSSGLAHLLAVSGLHVGLVGGGVWLCAVLLGAGPRTTRLIVLAALPAYALLAGASPSAMRAALMGVIYLGARLLGRAVLAMSAVLLAAFSLLLAQPALIAEPGFQLTVVITAALVRWVPPVAHALPGPRWLTGAVAVPVVAQTAAAPLVAWHFRSLIPGAVLANLLALPLLGPTVLTSVGATLIAPFWPFASAICLDVVRLLAAVLRFISGPARVFELVTPPLPLVGVLVVIVAGWLALQPGRPARAGALAWLAALAIFGGWQLLPPTSRPDSIELLPVTDGAAVALNSGRNTLLVDAGRYPREAAHLLAESGRRRLTAVAASHTDEDHIRGLVHILRSNRVERLLFPSWMVAEPAAVPLLRAARSRGVHLTPVARGSAVDLDGLRLEVLWPPALNPPREENERSLVARVVVEHGVFLITSDIGRQTEKWIAGLGPLGCDILVVAHHGSRSSTSSDFLDATSPAIALAPAGPGNTHGHPNPEVLARLAERGIQVRFPARDGWCGARFTEGRWSAFP